MAISWGSYSHHLRVGVDYTISPSNPSHSDTSVTVTWKYYVGTDGWNFDDIESFHAVADGWGGATTVFGNQLSSTNSSDLANSHASTYSLTYSTQSKDGTGTLSGAYNGANPTKTRTITIPARPVGVPGKPGTPSASSITGSSASITWSAPSDNGGASVDQYQIDVSVSSSFTSTAYTASGFTSIPRSATGLVTNTKYYVRTRAHNSAGWGSYGTTANFTTSGSVPGIPTNLHATSVSSTQIITAWTAPSSNGGGALTYTVQRATNSGFTTGLATGSPDSTTSHTSAALVANTTYWWRVKATNTNGDSAYTAGVSITTSLPPSLYGTDEGDFTILLGNLALAVGDMIGRLGMYTYRYHSAAVTITNSTYTSINMTSAGASRHNSIFTATNSGTTDLTVGYPGTYLLEFGFHWPMSQLISGHGLQVIYVNSISVPSTTTQKFGVQEYISAIPTAGDGSSPGAHISRHIVHLDAGDTVGWGAWHDVGSSITSGTSEPITAWCRVTLIGF